MEKNEPSRCWKSNPDCEPIKFTIGCGEQTFLCPHKLRSIAFGCGDYLYLLYNFRRMYIHQLTHWPDSHGMRMQ